MMAATNGRIKMIKEPMFISPKTIRDFEDYRLERARAQGWNEAMEFIFKEELEKAQLRIKSCWVHKITPNGDALCESCQNRNRCDVR